MAVTKAQGVQISTWEEAEAAMVRLAAAESARRGIQAEIDSEISAVHEQYREAMERQKTEAAELQASLAKFAKKHKRDFRAREEGGEVRSREHAGVVMGFRRTPPALRIEDEPKAVEFLRRFEGGAYLRVRTEPDRQGLADVLKDDSDAAVEKLAANGITLQQKDRFFCEVKEQK